METIYKILLAFPLVETYAYTAILVILKRFRP